MGARMPLLNICTSPGQLAPAPLPSAAVSATMLFPNDEARREQFYAIEAVGLYKQTGVPTEIPWAVASALHDAVLEKNFDEDTEKARRSGETVGLLYRVFLQCMIHHDSFASLNAALAVTGRLVERFKCRKTEPPDRPSSPSTLKQFWSSHKSVAHLWTAARLDQENRDQQGWIGWRINNDGLTRMLAMSEYLRTLGENYFAYGQTTPALDPSETWRPPEELALPEFSVFIPPIEPEILDEIAKVRAARRALTH